MPENNKVYCWTNKINDKKYFGRTKNSMNKRKNSKEMSGYKSCPAFWNAIKYYGVDNFELSIIEDNLTFEESVVLEKELIKKYDTTNPKYGYNILEEEPSDGHVLPDSSRKKISEKRKGKATSIQKGDSLTEEHKQHIKDSLIGKPMTEEHYKNFCEAMAKRRGQPTTHMPTKEEIENLRELNFKAVGIKETGEIFRSMTECSEAKGISLPYLSRKIKSGKPWKGLTFYEVCINA